MNTEILKKSTINNKIQDICIARTTYYDRSAFLKLSLEYQNQAQDNIDFNTYIFVDPHPKYGFVSDYDRIITSEYQRINWTENRGKYSWYDSIKYIFDNTKYEYIISIEDDILISKDYLMICKEIANENSPMIKNDDILFFHIGAWEKPKGDPNKIVRSRASLRSCLINRSKFFTHIKPYYDILKDKIFGLDIDLQKILDTKNMCTIAPETNRHGHIGIYGWSSNNIHKDMNGQRSLFEKPLSHDELYNLLRKYCLSGNDLIRLNQYKNPKYFWDFDPNINFKELYYQL